MNLIAIVERTCFSSLIGVFGVAAFVRGGVKEGAVLALEENKPNISGELRTSGEGSYVFSGSMCKQLALIALSKFILMSELREESECHCMSCCRSGKLVGMF
jgi:hypothetical protein